MTGIRTRSTSRWAGALAVVLFIAMLFGGVTAASGAAVARLTSAADVGATGLTLPPPLASCAATVLRIGSADLIPALALTPTCVGTQNDIPHISLLAIELSLASARTWGLPKGVVGGSGTGGDRVGSSVEVAEVVIGTIVARGLEASAGVGCAGGNVARSGRAHILSLTVGGRQLGAIGGPLNLSIPGVGTLHLNEVANTPDGLAVRVLRLESLLGDVVVGEAQAGLGSTACPTGAIVPSGVVPPGVVPPGVVPPGVVPPGGGRPPTSNPIPASNPPFTSPRDPASGSSASGSSSPASPGDPTPTVGPSSPPGTGDVPIRPDLVWTIIPTLALALFVTGLGAAVRWRGSGGEGGESGGNGHAWPLPGAREVRTGFAPMGDAGSAIDPSAALAAGRPYYFWVELGPPVESQAREQRAREGMQPSAARLSVVLFGFDGELLIEAGESSGELALDPEGRARVARHGRVPRGSATGPELLGRRVFFPVRTPKHRGDHRLRCNLYCGQTLVQSLLVHARVRHPLRQLLAERLRWLRRNGRSLIGADVDFALSRTLDPAHLEKLQPHALSILMNGDEATHGFRMVGQGGFTSSASFDDAEVQSFGDRLREALRVAACGDQAIPRDQYRNPSEERLAKDLIALARNGYRVWSGLVRRLAQGAPGGGPPERRLAALLRSSSRIQFVSRMGARHRLPASMIYDAPLDANRPDLVLCPAFLEALSAEAPLEDAACFKGNCPSWGTRHIVCPSGFWGFRHVIGMPQSLDPDAGGVLDVATEIAFGDAPTFVVGVSTDPDFVERSRHEQALRHLYPGLDWQYGDTRDEVLDLLERTQPHLVYLYCHGGSDRGSAFVEVGPPGDAVLTGDDLMYRVWWEATHPLVFVNGCHTTAVAPETALELVTAFVERQASGVIGTEVTVFEHLAGWFAEECLGRLMRGASIGDAIRSTRLALLKERNPLGLVYVAFVTDELRMVRSAEGAPIAPGGSLMAGSGNTGAG